VTVLGSLTAVWNRVFAVLGVVSMYRVVYLALATLAVISFLLSFFGLVAPEPLELIVTLLVLSAVCVGVDAAAQRVLHLPWSPWRWPCCARPRSISPPGSRSTA